MKTSVSIYLVRENMLDINLAFVIIIRSINKTEVDYAEIKTNCEDVHKWKYARTHGIAFHRSLDFTEIHLHLNVLVC